MKITRNQLKRLISEEMKRSSSVLLEMPLGATTGMKMGGQEPPEQVPLRDLDEESVKQQLFHIAAQANQLESMMADDEELSEDVRTKIDQASKNMNSAFRTIMSDKRPGAEYME